MSIIPHSFYFRHAIALKELKNIPHQKGRLLKLPAACALPDLTFQQESAKWGTVKLAWNREGLGISLKVDSKTHPTTPAETFQVWIDTRDTKNIHRANRYCHLFQFQACGNARKQPLCTQLTINRAQSDAPQCDLSQIKLWADLKAKGYELEAWLPAAALNGYDPAAYPQLGFYYKIFDSELGEQFMTINQEFPFGQDPSLWSTMRLES
ncbi:DOMON domain-containing protein [Gimesia panareensis]|uniref:Carbohydrate-binding domain-containing protein n=1 Tax=Gimesia panareensis TaxID=2527978 RepID=A0A518A796_9PLAN|nr:hypothetical protein [Gimesia panareensis]QDT26532.1 hypothetical protein Enr10x_18360 [Gimesia panareensis]QDU50589.1 hypothetical protein Pan110_29410 [Gimesia panareensis]QDV16141.1 hypothetical protein Pan153_07620 [Gimesia panareensis]